MMKKSFLLGLMACMLSMPSMAALYVHIDEDGNITLRQTEGTDFQSCVDACQNQKSDDVDTCDNTTYFGDPVCSACGGGIQAISGSCLPVSVTLSELTDCLYTTCLDSALESYRNCFQGCRQDYPRPKDNIGGATGLH